MTLLSTAPKTAQWRECAIRTAEGPEERGAAFLVPNPLANIPWPQDSGLGTQDYLQLIL